MTRILYLLAIIVIGTTSSANANTNPGSFADLVEKLTPAVVNISTTQTVESAKQPWLELFPNNDFENGPMQDLPDLFKRFYGMPDGGNGSPRKRKAASLGSGFVISADGYIVTNYHVIDKADEITVVFSDDTEATAKIIGKDAKTDIALLKVEVDKKLEFVKFGNSDRARVGDWVIAIGNPFGLGGSVSAGIISARARDINAGPFDDFIQTDAAINRGNSGGPLFNTEGEVIGVNSAIFSPSGGNVGIGFAVPTSLAEPVIKQLQENGHIERGWLGVKIQTVTEEIAESIGMKEAIGALVLDVTEDSPAGRAGILAGDVIVKFDNQNVQAMRKLPRIVAETPVGKKVPVVVWRNEKEKTLLVTVALLDEDAMEEESVSDNNNDNKESQLEAAETIAGIGIKDIDKSLRKKFNIDKDTKGVVVINIDSESEAAQKPIRKGDVISTINQKTVTNVEDAKKIVAEAKDSNRKSILLLISRGEDALFVALPIGE